MLDPAPTRSSHRGPQPWLQRSRCALLCCLLLAACSILPEAGYPPYCDHQLEAEFVVPADGWLAVPTSARDLLLRELASDPPPLAERYDERGQRFFAYPAGSRVRLRCDCRSYGNSDRPQPAPEELLPHALQIRSLPPP